MQIVNLPLDALTPYARNTRAHNDDDVEQIALSIRKYGFNDPIGVWSDKNIVVEGHGRLLAARALGLTEVPCIRLDHLTDDQRREYGIMHNKTAELSGWDFEALESELAELDLSDFGLTFTPEAAGALDDTEVELLERVQEDTAPAPPNDDPEKGEVVKPKSKRGQVWALGDHVLMCGDSTAPADMAVLMDGETADAVVTDPPYNVDISNAQGLRIANDKQRAQDFERFLQSAFSVLADNLKPGGAFYVWYSVVTENAFSQALRANGLQPKAQLVWVKNAATFSPLHDYQQRHEPCWYGWKQGAAHWFTRDRAQNTAPEGYPPGDPPVPWWRGMDAPRVVSILDEIYAGQLFHTTVEYEKKPIDTEHPTMKPVRLIALQIRNSTRPGEVVLDLFGGSGTTLIAAEQLGRKARIMELDPRYCDVIIERWEQFTGRKARQIR